MASNGALRMALTGDSIIVRKVSIYQDEPTRKLMEILQNSDVSFTNLEVLPNDFQGYPAVESGGSHFTAHSWVMDDLEDMGFNLFACANNHSLDYSIEGLVSTIEVLDEKNVAYAGIGHTLGESRMPTYLDTPAGAVAMISCSSSFAKGDEAGEQRPDMQGRPGLNPLRYDTTYEVTSEQLEQLRAISEGLGIEQQRLDRIKLGFGFPPDDPEVLPFLEGNFKPSDKTAVKTEPKEKDVAEIEKWVKEARRRADLVVVSLHAHEQGDSKEEPAEFIKTFARRVIDAGADMLVGHGPHLLRGLEIYKGKPIFYSLGNFIGQNELVWKLPADSYERFRVDPSETPGALYAQRYDNDNKGFPADKRFWESAVPVLTFDGNKLTGVEIMPVTLGLTPQAHHRGRPRISEGEEATSILNRFAELSRSYGTSMEIKDGKATVKLG